MTRRRQTEEDREFEKEFNKSLSVAHPARIDQMYEALTKGTEIQGGVVPDYGTGQSGSFSNENGSLFHMDQDTMFKSAAAAIGLDRLNNLPVAAEQPSVQKTASAGVNLRSILSSNQINALRRFPALIEVLGSSHGEKIALEIAAKVNEIMVEKVGENSREISKFAVTCKADRHNLKQYYVGENEKWVCCVIASGPFRGDEAFYFDHEEDSAQILRKVDNDYENVTGQFNIVHEYAVKE